MEAACSSETLSFIYRAVSCHKPENCRANHKSHTKRKDAVHVTKWMEGSTPPLILILALTEVNGQIHTPDAISLGKGRMIPITLHARWAPKPVWAFWWRKNNMPSWETNRLRGRKALTFRHRESSIHDRRFATLQRTLIIYLINKYISLSDICLTVHHWYK